MVRETVQVYQCGEILNMSRLHLSSRVRRRIQWKMDRSFFVLFFSGLISIFFPHFCTCLRSFFHNWSELKSHSRAGRRHLRQMVLTWPVVSARPDGGAVEAQMMPYWASSCSSKWLKASQGQMTVMSRKKKHSKHSDCCTNRKGNTRGNLRRTHLCLSPPFQGCHHQICQRDHKQ